MDAATTIIPAKQVKITAIQATCDTHGWTRESIVPTVFPLTDDFKDSNGQNIYVASVLRSRSVWLNSGEYQLVAENDTPTTKN